MAPQNTAYVCSSINKPCRQETWAQRWWICHETHKLGYEQQVFAALSWMSAESHKLGKKSPKHMPSATCQKPIKGTGSRAKIKKADRRRGGLQTPVNSHGNTFHSRNSLTENHLKRWKEPSESYTPCCRKHQNDRPPPDCFWIQPFGVRFVDNSVVLHFGSVTQHHKTGLLWDSSSLPHYRTCGVLYPDAKITVLFSGYEIHGMAISSLKYETNSTQVSLSLRNRLCGLFSN